MKYSDYFVFFGSVSLLLGILGYIRARSIPSLIAGGISGIGLVAGAILAARGQETAGYAICLVLSVLLLGKFLPGFLKTKAFYPGGILALLSVIGVVVGILGLTGK